MSKDANNPSTNRETLVRVLFADFAVAKYNVLIQLLKKVGVEGEGITEPARFLQRLEQEHFELAVINLLMGGIGPHELIASVKRRSRNPKIKIIVVSKQVQKVNIQNVIHAGASDFLAEPFENDHLYHRVLYHLMPKQEIETKQYQGQSLGQASIAYFNLLLDATELLSKTERSQVHQAFYTVLKRVAQMLDSNRTSLTLVEPDSNSGVVLASSDDPNFHDFPIALHKYPEIVDVMNTGNFVMIDDVTQHSSTQLIQKTVKSISIGSILVFPIQFQGGVIGTLTIRRPKVTALPSMDVIRVLQAIANTLAAHSNTRAQLRKIYREFTPTPKVA